MLSCTKCRTEKPATTEFFPPHNKKKNGLDSWCRSCRATYRSSINRGRFRDTISDEELLLLKSSVLECVICGESGPLVVDHDHKTNKIRGMLCTSCNLGLGHFKDDPYKLEFARIYILSSLGDPEADQYLVNGSED